jgi:glycosyltransferase involved in cell wall biosynthesis
MSATMAPRAAQAVRDRSSRRPLVSICMPAYNSSKWIGEAIESVLAQTWDNFELVIADDASSDSTVAIARSYSDPRIRVETAGRNMGNPRSSNAAVRLSTGTYVKFLHADDTLAPDCVEEMVGLAEEDERIGLVFAQREILVEDEDDLAWSQRYSKPHERFTHLQRSNDGQALFKQLLDAGVEENWIGEPSAVMVSRRCLEESGLFNPRLHQIPDLELWMRIMLRHRVGFVDRPLCVYRRHRQSYTAANSRVGRDWLDRLWLCEGLLKEDALGPEEREAVERLRRAALRRAMRSQLGRLLRRRFDSELLAYARYRASRQADERCLLPAAEVGVL